MPAGNSDGGRWTPIGAGAIGDARPAQGNQDVTGNILLAAGIAPEQRGMVVQDFVSAYCRAEIYSILPGQFLGMTIVDVMRLAQSGNAAARTCMKLLKEGRFRK